METLYRVGLSNAMIATVLALVVACLGRVLERRPAVLHCLWLLVLVKLVTPPIYTVSVPWPKPSTTANETASVSEGVLWEQEREPIDSMDPDFVMRELAAADRIPLDEHPARRMTANAAIRPSIDWTRLACFLWVAGAVTTLMVSLVRIRRFQRLLGEAQPAAEDTQEWVEALAARLGLDRGPSVWWIDGRLSPLVWPVGWRPKLILPVELWKGLDHHQRTTLIIHELAHLRRGDHQLRLFELLVTALYWWHPVVWWARHALRDAEEQCCDAWVVWAFPDAARSYADTLLETLDFLNPSDLTEPLLASGFGKVHHLRRRLTMIMSGTTPRFLGPWGTLGSLVLAVMLLPVHATWAQKTEEQKGFRIVVSADGNATASATAVATTDGDKPEVSTVTVTAVEDGKSGRLMVKSGDPVAAEMEGSRDEVIKKLKDQIKEIDKKSPLSSRDKARRLALAQTLKALEKMHATENIRYVLFTGEEGLVGGFRTRVRGYGDWKDDNKESGADNNAEINKARAQVEELTQAVQSKHKELAAAHQRLTKLLVAGRVRPKIIAGVAPPRREEADVLQKELPAFTTTKPVYVKPRYTVVRPIPHVEPGQKRIDELEKKLEKLLEEVAALKKDRVK